MAALAHRFCRKLQGDLLAHIDSFFAKTLSACRPSLYIRALHACRGESSGFQKQIRVEFSVFTPWCERKSRIFRRAWNFGEREARVSPQPTGSIARWASWLFTERHVHENNVAVHAYRLRENSTSFMFCFLPRIVIGRVLRARPDIGATEWLAGLRVPVAPGSRIGVDNS